MSESTQAWGFTRADLEKYGVTLRVNVDFRWANDTPEHLRKVLAEASHVLHSIGIGAILAQLRFDGLGPTKTRNILWGQSASDGTIVITDSGWK